MRTRWLAAVGVVVLGAGAAAAQSPLPPLPPASELPPLLPAPPANPPLAEVPRPGAAPGIDYDPGYLYLPERAPERPRRAHRAEEECGPGGRWWVSPELGLAWFPTRPAPSTVRLRIPDPASLNGTLPGPLLPLAGRTSGRFDAALGLTVGRWFGEGNLDGVEAGFFLRDSMSTFAGIAPGALVVFPRGNDQGEPQVVPLPEPLAGHVASAFPVTLSTFYTTVDVNYRHRLRCTENARLDALVGYRFAYLEDEVYLGDGPDSRDGYRRNRAAVSNPFHGGQIGLAGEYRADGWYVAGSAKVAFGVVSPEVTATGLFVGAEGRAAGGFRRLSALDHSERNEFAVMPVLNVSVGRQVTDHSRIYAGYSFQYLSRVGRLGDALDPAAGALTLTDFYVQSVNFGFELRY